MLRMELASVAKILSLLACFALIYADANPDDGHVEKSTREISPNSEKIPSLKITMERLDDSGKSEADGLLLYCNMSGSAKRPMWWTRDEKNLTDSDPTGISSSGSPYKILKLNISGINDTGNYTCMARTAKGIFINETTNIRLIELGKISAKQSDVQLRLGDPATLSCLVSGFPLAYFAWSRVDDIPIDRSYPTNTSNLNETHLAMTLDIASVKRRDNGIYKCQVDNYNDTIFDSVSLEVLEAPEVSIKFVKSVGASVIYFNWTVYNGHNAVRSYKFLYIKNGTQQWQPCWRGGSNSEHTSTVVNGSDEVSCQFLKSRTTYQFQVIATNSIGDSPAAYSEWVTTLEKDPDLTPTMWIEATTLHSIRIGWSLPPELQEYVSLFQALIWNRDWNKYRKWRDIKSTPFIFEDLDPETSYKIGVRACSSYAGDCWVTSSEVDTKDRDPEFVPIVSIEATESPNSITINWSMPPPSLEDRVHQYKVIATRHGTITEQVYLNRTVNSHVFENLESGTSYLLKVAACGEYKTQCGNWSEEREVSMIAGEGKSNLPIWISMIVIVVLLVSIVVFMGIKKYREMVSRKKFREEVMKHYNNIVLDCLDPGMNMGDQAAKLPCDKKWEFPKKLLKFGIEAFITLV